MEKHLIVFSKNQNWCIYSLDLEQGFDPRTQENFFILDKKVLRSTRDTYRVPTCIKYSRRVESKYVFDSRAEAIQAVDGLIRDNILEALLQKEKSIALMQEEMEKLKQVQPRGRFTNLLVNRNANKLLGSKP